MAESSLSPDPGLAETINYHLTVVDQAQHSLRLLGPCQIFTVILRNLISEMFGVKAVRNPVHLFGAIFFINMTCRLKKEMPNDITNGILSRQCCSLFQNYQQCFPTADHLMSWMFYHVCYHTAMLLICSGENRNEKRASSKRASSKSRAWKHLFYFHDIIFGPSGSLSFATRSDTSTWS